MEPLLSRLIVQAAPRSTSSLRCSWSKPFSISHASCLKERKLYDTASATDSAHSRPAVEQSQQITNEEKDHFSVVERESKKLQTRSPWMHDGADVPPVTKHRSAGAMVKGKLLTTPSRMLKLILPLTTRDANQDRKDVEPLALLVHPQQPLSYLERLIQSELPFMWDEKKGRERAPDIVFRALDNTEEDFEKQTERQEEEELQDAEETVVDGKVERTGKISGGRETSKTHNEQDNTKQDHPGDPTNFVRWSPSTEIGDFIRDAARGKEFAVDIEGAPESVYVGVPSFHDRTYYLRMRLRKISKRIATMADVKKECDELAHRGAKNVARLGFGALLGWWGAVYYLTFRTELGWDVMEPVTYLVGLSGLIGGYMWFLYHNKEASYRSAMHVTVSRRQDQLYKAKGFNQPQWEMLIEEGNRLRREVKLIADEYDVEWDETKDEGDEKVREALRKERKKKEGKEKDDKKDKDDNDEEDD